MNRDPPVPRNILRLGWNLNRMSESLSCLSVSNTSHQLFLLICLLICSPQGGTRNAKKENWHWTSIPKELLAWNICLHPYLYSHQAEKAAYDHQMDLRRGQMPLTCIFTKLLGCYQRLWHSTQARKRSHLNWIESANKDITARATINLHEIHCYSLSIKHIYVTRRNICLRAV